MQLKTVQDSFVMFLHLLGRQKAILDLPDEIEAKHYNLESIKSSLEILYMQTITSPCMTSVEELLVVKMAHSQLIRLVRRYEKSRESINANRIRELEEEVSKLISENNYLNSELEEVTSRRPKPSDFIEKVDEQKPQSLNSSWFSFGTNAGTGTN